MERREMTEVIYSIVIPVKDEAENLQELFTEIFSVMSSLKVAWEVIFVDDGSTDQSAEIIRQLAKDNNQVRLLSFTQNRGQSVACAAGFAKASGSFVITCDADRQNDPADIPRLIDALGDADLVVGWRIHRRDPWQKKIISRISNTIRRRLLHDGSHDTGCSLKLLRKSALDKIKMYEGMHRFLPALFLIEGFRIKEIPVNHRPRIKGKTKYHFFNRSLRPFIDLFAVYWMKKRHIK